MKMKQILFLVFAVFSATTLKAQNPTTDYLFSKLISGYPPEAAFFINEYKPSHLKYTPLATGTDSLKVVLGAFTQDENKGYYVIVIHNKKYEFRTVNLKKSDSLPMLSDELNFKFDNQTRMVSVQVQHNSATDEVSYTWLKGKERSKIATIQTAGLIHPNNPMPDFEFKTLDGTVKSLNDFKGKYLIINWWSTTCGPCVTEMPVLNKMVEKYKLRTDVAFVAIAWDEKETLESFLRKRDFKYEQTYSKELAALFGQSFPKHVIVNPQGIVAYYNSGLEMEVVEGKTQMKKQLAIEEAIESQLKN